MPNAPGCEAGLICSVAERPETGICCAGIGPEVTSTAGQSGLSHDWRRVRSREPRLLVRGPAPARDRLGRRSHAISRRCFPFQLFASAAAGFPSAGDGAARSNPEDGAARPRHALSARMVGDGGKGPSLDRQRAARTGDRAGAQLSHPDFRQHRAPHRSRRRGGPPESDRVGICGARDLPDDRRLAGAAAKRRGAQGATRRRGGGSQRSAGPDHHHGDRRRRSRHPRRRAHAAGRERRKAGSSPSDRGEHGARARREPVRRRGRSQGAASAAST